MNEGRDANAPELGAGAHGQLVAKVARRRLAHARNADMLAEPGHELDVIVIERCQTIDVACSRQIAHGPDHRGPVFEAGKREDFVDEFAAPGLIQKMLDRQQNGCTTRLLASLDERIALEVAGDTNDRDRLRQGHGSCYRPIVQTQWGGAQAACTRARSRCSSQTSNAFVGSSLNRASTPQWGVRGFSVPVTLSSSWTGQVRAW